MGVFQRASAIQPVKNDGYESVQGSMVSMTQSQLNTAVMNMLHVSQNSCQEACRGNPITKSGKRKQLLKMLIVVLVPIGILVGMTGNTFVAAIESYLDSKAVRAALFFSIELGQMLRYLQRERDMSALYVSSIGPVTKTFLLKRYPETDAAFEALSSWPVSAINSYAHFATKEKFVLYLNKHRYQLDLVNNRTSKEEILFYSDAIDIFINWLYNAISESRTGSVWKYLVAYQEIVVASEYIGRERSFGATYFIYGEFPSQADYLVFLEAQDTANLTFQSCRRYSELAYNIYEEELRENSELINPVNRMRYEIRANKNAKLNGSIEMANYWFDNMTHYQEVVRKTQRLLADKIDTMLLDRSASDLQAIITISCVFALVLIVCPLIVFAVYALTSEIQTYSSSIANQTKALNKEKQRTDTLLYQMLPRSVAIRLKHNEQVDAEMFPEATIFFSDIVGFTKISSQSSPLQVVDMLNRLYICFDERIEMYDVYKVETIGDAYMVVSGVPRQNGKRHAGEIGTLALDLLQRISHLEIPHLPGIKFKLRIGCHTGCVVAGIVGIKMPRYCLFGETVAIASKMESLGKASRVHVSETAYQILKELGEFYLEERKDTIAKNDPDLQNFFKENVRTYWLLGKEGMENENPLSSSSAEDLPGF